ncbi:filamentous hemagglutinin N-terminal domain-containing protein [Rhodopseudomonas sp.]|uniref:two-partner secretion domain-containing protein n=1 Tax=Rhodopseudomonas sp. TaxID=1078 RepID=UPI0039E6F8AC
MLLATTALISPALALPAAAQTLPTGGSVAAGNVSIAQPNAAQMTITQTSQSAVVNWQSFSIGGNAAVAISQPNASSALLNRVTSNTPSTIAGQLTANGQVYLVNPNGITITSTGTVNTGGGFVASTLGITDSDFMSERRTFTGTGSSAPVRNEGTIRVGRGGYAALIGGTVSNSGSIEVPLGKVGLGSGEQATLDFSGDGFLQVAAPTKAGGDGALVSSAGAIKADGGSVVISAATAREAARNAVNISGLVQARSIGGRSGSIVIGGGSGGDVTVTGRLDVSSRRHAGGSVTATGKTIALKGATVKASGATGGGTVNIGGGRQGAGPLPHADAVTIDAVTTIEANATRRGNGGSVTVWSDIRTGFAGTISAKGGPLGGDGGTAEVSSKAVLAYIGFTDLSAPHGAFGTLLLDPYNIIISTGATTNTSGFTPSGNDSVINAATLMAALGSANVTLSTGGAGSAGAQAGDITVAAPLTWSANTTLTLDANHAIAINAPITVTGAGGVALNYDTSSPTNLSFAQGATIDYGSTNHGGTLSINGQSYSLLYNMADVAGVNGNLSGRYALASNLDASGNTYTTGVIAGGDPSAGFPSPFSGTFEGLGHTISNLTIAAGNNNLVGLIGYSTGAVRDIGLSGAAVTGSSSVGGLVGRNSGTIAQSSAAGTVSGDTNVGGLVGFNEGWITSSSAAATVDGTSNHVGGLVGTNYGAGVSITESYSTGAVKGGSNVGGLVGWNYGGAAISQAYAGGTVSGMAYVGGLVGTNDYTSAISQAYATGAVNGGTYVGGLVGQNSLSTITQAYATGAVSGQARVGGIAGVNVALQGYPGGTITQAYFDTQTTGQTNALGWDNNHQTVTGLTTRQLQGLDPISGSTSFSVATNLGDGTTSAFAGGSGGLYPYLSSFFPGGVQAVSGFAYKDGGATPLASGATVGVIANGASFGSATTGANGYYYVFGPSGSFAGGNPLLAYTNANNATGAQNAATLAGATSTANQSGINIYGNAVTVATTATTLSAAPTRSQAQASALLADGGIAAAATAINGASGRGFVATGASFTVDESVTTGDTFVVRTTAANAPIKVTSPITIQSGGSLGLYTTGALALGANVTVNGSGSVGFAYDAASPTNFSFARGASLSYFDASGNALGVAPGNQSLTINGQNYSLLYNMADVAGVNGNLSGRYALASNLDASGTTYTTGVIAGGDSSGSIPTAFNGTLEGLGHTISNLTIAGGSNSFVGLIGNSGGTVRDIGLTAAAISGDQYVGGLVGWNSGGVIQTDASGTVNGSRYVGGLVGYNIPGSTIRQAYATGTVTGQYYVGGLVGENDATITQAFATGAVNGQTVVGGLVGGNYGTITQAYVTGAVSGQYSVGGLVGYNNGTITQGYFDTQTTGQGGVGGLTTRQLQGLDPVSNSTYFSVTTNLGDGTTSAFAGGSGGLYPYLSSFFPGGVQAISGTAYKDGGTTPLASGAAGAATVSVASGGSVVGSATTGANGYYYVFAPAGTFAANAGVVAFTQADSATGAKNGASFVQSNGAANSNVSVDVWGDWRRDQPGSGLGTLSALDAAYAATIGATAPSGFTPANRQITAPASFTVDRTLTASGSANVRALGDLPIASTGSVSGSAVTLAATGAFINNRGSDAVTATSDRWLIYSANPSGDTFGGLDSGNTAIWNTAPGATVSQNGNRYVFTYQPTLTVSSTSATKVYGTDATSQIAGNYTITGFAPGAAGAYLGDTAANVIGGTPTVMSIGAAATAAVSGSPYAITVSQGSMTAGAGYALNFANTGTLTVTPRSITVTADAQSRISGNANPTLTYAVGGLGLVNGDVLTGALATSATMASSAGTYAITQGSLLASPNYALTYVGADLTITAAPVSIRSTPASQIVQADFRPAFVPISTVPIGGAPNMSQPLGTGIFISDPRFDQAFVFFGVMPPYRGQL